MGARGARPMLVAKTMVPPTRAGVVVRPRLHERLRSGRGGPCTVVVAPAGWGKSTLLSSWAHDPAEHRGVAWVSLDETDDEPVRFWTCAITALTAVAPELTAEPLAALDGQGLDTVDVALPALLNALTATEGEYVLVLDDYHVLADRRIHESVEFLLSYLPPALHLVIASRTDPPLPLARMRARGDLAEVRLADLRCTDAEGVAFLAVAGDTPPAVAAGLVARTEGWPAGLHLAAIVLRTAEDPDVAASTIRGGQRHILDYFLAEVLPSLDDETRELLVRCSVLARLSGPLCDAVLDTTGSAAVLDRLERADLFVSALDLDRQWYRCHQLFRDVLRRELDVESPGAAPTLLERAGEWFLAAGRIEDAVSHRIAAGDRDGAVALLDGDWFLAHGAMPALLRFGEQLVDRCANDAELCLWLAYAAGLSWQTASAVRWLEAAEPLLDQDPPPSPGWHSRRACADALWASYGLPDDIDASLRYARRAVERETDPSRWGWTAAWRTLGGALYGAGRVAEQVAVLDEAWREPARRHVPALLLLQTAGVLVLGLVELGQLDQARQVSSEVAATATAIAQSWGDGAAAALTELRLAEARLALAECGPSVAIPALRHAVELAEGYRRSTLIVAASTSLAEALWATGERSAARTALDHAQEVSRPAPPARRSPARRAPGPDRARRQYGRPPPWWPRRGAHRPRAGRPACPPRTAVGTRDRPRAPPLDQHRQGLQQEPVPQARCRHPP